MGELDDLARHAEQHDFSVEMERGRWESDTVDDPMVTTSLRLPKSLLDWVRDQAAERRVKPTALIRQWIEQRRSGDDDLASRVDRLEQTVFRDAG